MSDIKDMTGAELVEAVAREVMGNDERIFYLNNYPHLWDENKAARRWNPFSYMNDLQMVKDKLREMGYKITIIIYPSGDTIITLCPFLMDGEDIEIDCTNETRAWLEAALAAKRGEK